MEMPYFKIEDTWKLIDEINESYRDKFNKDEYGVTKTTIQFEDALIRHLKKLSSKFSELEAKIRYDRLFDELFDILKNHFNSSDENYDQLHDLIVLCYKYFGNSKYKEAKNKYTELKNELNKLSDIIQEGQSKYDKSKNLKCISDIRKSNHISSLRINGVADDFEFASRLYRILYGKYVGYNEDCVTPNDILAYINKRTVLYADFIEYCTVNNLTPEQAVKNIMEVK